MMGLNELSSSYWVLIFSQLGDSLQTSTICRNKAGRRCGPRTQRKTSERRSPGAKTTQERSLPYIGALYHSSMRRRDSRSLPSGGDGISSEHSILHCVFYESSTVRASQFGQGSGAAPRRRAGTAFVNDKPNVMLAAQEWRECRCATKSGF